MKNRHIYTPLILLILIFSGLFGIATAADAQEVHALLICLGDDLNIRASVNVNEEKMTALLLQVSESCNVNLTIMKSVKVGRGVVTKMTFANGNTIRASDQEQGLINTAQVVQWLEKLRPEADDTLLVYYNGHGGVYGKTHMLHFNEVKKDFYNRSELKEMLAQKQARLKMLITDTCKNRVDTPPPNVDKYAQPRAKNRRYTDHLFLQHEGMLDITAASTNQFALANDQLGGFFTAALIESFSEEADTKIKGGVGDNDGFLSWQEVFAKCVWETQNLFSQSESDFDSALSKDLDEKEQTTQTPEQFSLPTRIGSDSDSVPLQPPKSIPSTAILNFTSVPFGGGGGSVPPQTPMIGATLQNADNAFDDAETTEVHDDPEKMEKYRQKQQELYDKAMTLYSEVIERDTKGKYAQRAHYQIAKIYKRRYDWDKANEHYQAIVALDPTGYYANEAKSGTANIRKNREVIKVKRAEYQNYKAIYDTEPTDETFNIAAEALYEVARAYESLENYTEAIRHYERLVEEFPEHAKAPQAQFQTGTSIFTRFMTIRVAGPPSSVSRRSSLILTKRLKPKRS